MARILIFGGTGSLGKHLIERYAPNHRVYVYSRDEAKHWTIKNGLSGRKGLNPVTFLVGDIRDPLRVKEAIDQVKPEIIIIAAALKQVDTCELSPNESVATNLQGTQNVIRAVNDSTYRVQKVLFVSTDKACAPVNVYGMCKAISERIVTSQAQTGHTSTKYLAVRYGNVLESRGSIIPLFQYQAENNDHLTVTDPDMTRFLMTLNDSVDLIETALELGSSGETWIPKLPAMRIGDLAEIYASRSGKQVKIIGLRPGEKQHEDLINSSESSRTRSSGNHYVIGPAFTAGTSERFTYSSSDEVMTKDGLEQYLNKLGILGASLDQFHGRDIEEIRRT